MKGQALRASLLNTTRELARLGLNRGTSGNVSVRDGDDVLITPSGIEVDDMTPHDMVAIDLQGKVHSQAEAPRKPSSEWRFHVDIYQARPEVRAVIHTHSMFATTLACLRKELPPFHYMIAVAGGDNVRCAPYALFGSQALSDGALAALQGRRACLLANHGMITVGADLKQALDVALEIETLCEQYLRALQVGEPHLLSAEEMEQVMRQFQDYSKWGSPA